LSSFTDPAYLRREQYRDDSNLRARIDLHERFTTATEPWHRWVFDRIDLASEARILEIGCGPAELWAQNLDRILAGWELTLADLSPGMVEKAREVLGDRADYRVADVRDLPFEDASFDGVVANHMLYHVPDRTQALVEIRRVLGPGGRVFATTNGREHLREIKTFYERSANTEFRIEDAGDELADFFADVELDCYPGGLEVTAVEPVLAFLRSMDHGIRDGADTAIAGEIERHGVFRVTTSAGLFRCRKP
jgi:SAM-dependent methyltransferase